nr:MAG TPA: hypothetical protein [Bacteriophage sp.]
MLRGLLNLDNKIIQIDSFHFWVKEKRSTAK